MTSVLYSPLVKQEVVSALLNSGGQPDVRGRSGDKMWSALHFAAFGGHTGVAQMLVTVGADPAYIDLDGVSPLHLAIRHGHVQLARYLLLSGAPASARDKKGSTPLHLAAAFGHIGIVSQLLFNGAEVNMLDKQGRSALHPAVRNGHLASAKILLGAGANPSLRHGPNQYSALDEAVRFDASVEMVRELLRYGADVNSRSPAGETALHLAGTADTARAIDALVEAGADVEAREYVAGWTPLHYAARKGSVPAVLALLQRKADIDASDIVGRSPLEVACGYLAEGAADLLLKWGANETGVNNSGHSAYQAVGTLVEEGDLEKHTDGVNRLHKLLAQAARDRVWCRRGWLVMYRAFPERVLLALHGTLRREKLAGHGAETRTSTPETNENGMHLCNGRKGNTIGSDGVGAEARADDYTVEASLILLEEDCLFRNVVSFL